MLSVVAGCTGTAVDHGEALFEDPAVTGSDASPYACSTCHEAVQGDAGDLILPGAVLAGVVDRSSYWGGQEIELLRSVNHCLYYFMFKSTPWTGEEEEARAMYAYLESLSDRGSAEPAPFTVVYEVYDVPGGDAGRGAELYGRACQTCHGAAHTGEDALVSWAPVLPEDFVAEHPDDQYSAADRRLVMIEKVRHGAFVGYSGQMPPFSAERISDDALGDLLEYLGLSPQ
jgi:thiosulfate dehydrogenase